ncbi:MAG: Kelch repeat-containing protein [Chloroflexota bacterium]
MPELGDPISERELDVLNCLAEGDSNREIAKKLSISHNTVKVHVRNIFTKLGVSSRTEATTVALQQGVLSIPGVEVETEEAEAEGEAGEESEVVREGSDAPAPENGAGAAAPATARDAGAQAQSGPNEAVAGPNRRLALIGAVVIVAALIVALFVIGDFRGAVSAPDEPTATATNAPLFEETEVDENWLLSRPLPQPRAHMVVANIGLNLYAIGGETAEGVDNSLYIYDTQRREWRQGAPKLTAVADAAAEILGGEIYVMGGRTENGNATTVVEAYSPLNDGWRPVTALPHPVAGALALSDDSRLFLIGGRQGDDVLSDVVAYDPATQQWQSLPPLQQARAHAAGGVLDGHLYVVGGSEGQQTLSSCEKFDPAAREWLSCPDLLQPRAGAGSAVFLDKLYVLGGEAGDAVTGSEVYDATTEQWSEFSTPALKDAAAWAYLGVANVETRIYALGGNQDGELSEEMYVYRPFFYQFFIPAASAGEE